MKSRCHKCSAWHENWEFVEVHVRVGDHLAAHRYCDHCLGRFGLDRNPTNGELVEAAIAAIEQHGRKDKP